MSKNHVAIVDSVHIGAIITDSLGVCWHMGFSYLLFQNFCSAMIVTLIRPIVTVNMDILHHTYVF